MDRKRVIVFGVAAICALTLAVAAASVGGAGGSGSASGLPRFDVEKGPVGDVLGSVLGVIQLDGIPITAVLDVLIYLPGLVGIVVVGRAVWNRLSVEAGVLTVLVSLLGIGSIALFQPRPVSGSLPVSSNNGTLGNLTMETSSSGGPEVTIWLTPIVVVLVGGGLLAATVYLTGDDEREDPSTEPFEAKAVRDLKGVGEAAGEAAEQLDAEESFENAIYEAWTEMTRSLVVEEPETMTPGEFADVAVEAGLSEADVEELTGLFEVVRYGQTPVTEERRQRAQEALEHIESTYAEVTDE